MRSVDAPPRLNGATLVLATHNRGKIAEVAALLADCPVRLRTAAELGLAEPEETEESFAGNARLKALAARKATGLPALADDSGLEIAALGGAPGVRTADWATFPEGRDFDRAMARAAAELQAIGAAEPWAARFTAVLALALSDDKIHYFQGFADGHLVWPPRGPHGHGFDPMFVPAGSFRTFAEMPEADKNRFSHRGGAIRAFREACFT